jgi:putative two-component system response regulator
VNTVEPCVESGQDPVKILIIDDTATSRMMTAELLSKAGYEVLDADSGERGLQLVYQHDPDLILLDVVMPGIDGYSVCATLKNDENTRLIPVIFMTSLEDKSARIRGIESGGDDFLTKPCDPVELFARVKSLVQQKRLNQDLDHAEQVLFSIAQTVESRDPNTGDHCERLVHRGRAFGEFLGLSRIEIRDLGWGGYLHDIGKVGIPDAILLKPGRFTAEEFDAMKLHTLIGENICKPLRTMRGVLPIIRHHHERWDGTGYPDRLSQNEIPLLAQVFQIIDIYDALVSERPYKQAMSPQKALQIMQEETDKGWRNADLVRQFCHYIHTIELKIPTRIVWFDRYIKSPDRHDRITDRRMLQAQASRATSSKVYF